MTYTTTRRDFYRQLVHAQQQANKYYERIRRKYPFHSYEVVEIQDEISVSPRKFNFVIEEVIISGYTQSRWRVARLLNGEEIMVVYEFTLDDALAWTEAHRSLLDLGGLYPCPTA